MLLLFEKQEKTENYLKEENVLKPVFSIVKIDL